MNQHHVYEWLKGEYIQNNKLYDLQKVIIKFSINEFDEEEIKEGYKEFNDYALPNLRHLWE
jgi:hypothetical protein